MSTEATSAYNEILESFSNGSPPADIDERMDNYLKTVHNKSGEHNKRAYLKSVILEEWLNIKPDVIGFEDNRNDIWVGGIIVETKDELTDASRDKAKQQCVKYKKDREKKGQDVERSIITDGIQFEVYSYHSKPSGGLKLKQEDGFDLRYITARDGFEQLYNAFFPQDVNLAMEETVVFTRFYSRFQDFIDEIEREVSEDDVDYRVWKQYLANVYGESKDDEALMPLFARQTYLYILSIVVSARAVGVEETSYERLFDQELLDHPELMGVYGMVDNDSFFNWVPDTLGDNLIEAIDTELENFNFDEQHGDFFRLLYESVVTAETRHSLGEFYTPTWLADLLTDHVHDDIDLTDKTVLDPGCGSGTFLRLAIEKKLEEGQSIEEITSEVVGFDINPIAVSITRANYLLALHDHIKDANSWVKIPVFLADSLMPDLSQREDGQTQEIIEHSDDSGIHGVSIPFSDVAEYATNAEFWYDIDSDLNEIDQQVLQLRKVALGDQSLDEAKRNVPENVPIDENEALIEQWSELNKNGDDHVWGFILKNIYTPNYYRGRVDVLLGNPPWLTYKDINLPERQEMLDELYNRYNMGSGWHVKTQQDLGAFFITRGQEYFDGDPYMAFVFTRAVFNGSQYDPLRRGDWDGPTLKTVFDIEDGVNPFRVPSSMVVLEGTERREKIDGYRISEGEGGQ